jgi:AGCS family alanine or glycine:cation symporter
MVQSNSVASLVNETFGISPYLTGIVITVLTALVILGGIHSIARVCEGLVPIMAVGYVVGCVVILAIQLPYLDETLSLILRSAVGLEAVSGGAVGAAVAAAARDGIARGLFSNEAGLGSAPIVAAAAQTRNPVRQALVSATGTFWDTVVICALTGLVVVSSLVKYPSLQGLEGATLTKAVFSAVPGMGPAVLVFGLLTFVYSTILGWTYYGERAVEYLAGKRAILPFRVLWVIAVMVGAVVPLKFVWDFADAANALMAIPNLIALLP